MSKFVSIRAELSHFHQNKTHLLNIVFSYMALLTSVLWLVDDLWRTTSYFNLQKESRAKWRHPVAKAVFRRGNVKLTSVQGNVRRYAKLILRRLPSLNCYGRNNNRLQVILIITAVFISCADIKMLRLHFLFPVWMQVSYMWLLNRDEKHISVYLMSEAASLSAVRRLSFLVHLESWLWAKELLISFWCRSIFCFPTWWHFRLFSWPSILNERDLAHVVREFYLRKIQTLSY